MRIQHNIMAMNAYRNYTSNTGALSKNLEKLSSGYKINRAGDDAAGLAISEKMRAQVTGLKTAQKNAKDGISLVQTAEGALTEVHSMLNRMVELADQSANGTYDNTTDRANLQKEFDALRSEIDRISKATNFNGIKLLDGSLGAAATITADAGAASIASIASVASTAATFATGATTAASASLSTGMNTALGKGAATLAASDVTAANAAQTITVNGQNITFTLTGSNAATATDTGATLLVKVQRALTAAVGTANTTASTAALAGSAGYTKVGTLTVASSGKVTGNTTAMTFVAATPGTPAVPSVAAKAAKTTLDFTGKTGADVFGKTITYGGKTYEFVENASEVTGTNTALVLTGSATAGAIASAVRAGIVAGGMGSATAGTPDTIARNGSKLVITNGVAGATGKSPTVAMGGGGLGLQIGDTSDSYNQISVSVGNMNCATLGIDSSVINIDKQKSAAASVQTIKDAINKVSSTRGDLGATQNRLEHTINNLAVMTENIQDAEANIRDVDVAEEMMAYTKNNILVQSAQAMLAQANQVPQGVLQLLQ